MLLAKLLSRIFKKNGIILIDSQGQKYICGKPDLNKPLILKLLKNDLNWRITGQAFSNLSSLTAGQENILTFDISKQD